MDSLQIESPAFQNHSPMPAKYTCDGEDIPPPLQWGEAPEGTQSFVLIVDDPDAPDPRAPRQIWVHWLVYNIPASSRSLGPELPEGALEGINDARIIGWGGPCPPRGEHRYFYKLYALDTVLVFRKPPTKPELLKAMKGHILSQGEMVGLYQRKH